MSQVLRVEALACLATPIVLPNVSEGPKIEHTLSQEDVERSVGNGIESVLGTLSQEEINEFAISIQSNAAVPKLLDGRVLASCRTELKRDLTVTERSAMRKRFLERLKSNE